MARHKTYKSTPIELKPASFVHQILLGSLDPAVETILEKHCQEDLTVGGKKNA